MDVWMRDFFVWKIYCKESMHNMVEDKLQYCSPN